MTIDKNLESEVPSTLDDTATRIIRDGLDNGDSYEVINARLKEAGCKFRLAVTGKTGWTEEEMKEGFIPAESETKDPVHLTDYVRRNEGLAGKEIEVWCVEGKYRIKYDIDGYCKGATHI